MTIAPPVSTASRLTYADDQCSLQNAFEKLSQGDSIVFTGSYSNARQLLSALGRHLDKRARSQKAKAGLSPKEVFHQQRLRQSQRTSLLNRLLVEVEPGYRLKLKKAPDIAAACEAAFLPLENTAFIPLRQILGATSAWEWRKKGLLVEGLSQPIHVHYGVFSPVRGEYLKLVRTTALPAGEIDTAVDLGTGSGVIAALLATRGVKHIIATDTNPEALNCAAENFERLGITSQTTLIASSAFPEGRFKLIVCNPPWLPGRPTSILESAVYDPDSQMTRFFLQNLAQHLSPEGEGWLIMSDLAERLGLRPADSIESWAAAGGLTVLAKEWTRPTHPRANDTSDPLYEARSAETTYLWRFCVKK